MAMEKFALNYEVCLTVTFRLDVSLLVCHPGHAAIAEVAGHPLIDVRTD